MKKVKPLGFKHRKREQKDKSLTIKKHHNSYQKDQSHNFSKFLKKITWQTLLVEEEARITKNN